MRLAGPLLVCLAATSSAAGRENACGTEPGGHSGALALHRYWSRAGALATTAADSLDRDVRDIAVLEDQGDLIARRNPFDLGGAAIRLTPNAAGAFDPARLSLALEPPGSLLVLADDESRALDLPFAFPFYGRAYTRVFVHADGNLTLGAPDVERGERGLARFLSGPPRLAPFFADLDPARGGNVTATLTGADRKSVV